MKTYRIIPLLVGILSLAASFAQAGQVTAGLSSNFLVRGEEAMLAVRVLDGRPDSAPIIPEVPGLKIVDLTRGEPRMEPLRGNVRRAAITFYYQISSYQLGPIRIPPIQTSVDGRKEQTDPINLEVFAPESLTWNEGVTEIKGAPPNSGKTIRYAAVFRSAKLTPYNGESIPMELKLYFPENDPVEDWGIPEFSRDGLAAWRFEPNRLIGRAILLGKSYIGVSYPTIATPIRNGKVTMGPATVRLQTEQAVQNRFGFSQVYAPLVVEVPALDLESKALPPGAPAGFDGAVGKFDIASFADETEVREGDPISVTVSVAGSGNLDAIKVPKPTETKGWKLYEATALSRGEERRELQGLVSFRQFMRPLELQPQVPSFQMIYFDPEKEAYQTIRTKPIPLKVTPAPAAASNMAVMGQNSPPPSLPIPVERMTDILGIKATAPVLAGNTLSFKTWYWQIVPALLALGLAFAIFWRWLKPRLSRDPRHLAIRNDLRELERSANNDLSFFRSAGNFIEKWLGTAANDPSLAAILAERDQRCFRKDSQPAPLAAPKARDIIATLRRFAVPLVVLGFLFFAPPALRAAEEGSQPATLYQQGRYVEAIEGWLNAGPYEQLTADTLYNIGNAYYKLGAEGDAALYYRRALARDSTHLEASQNLRFLERKLGSIVVSIEPYQLYLAKLSRAGWAQTIAAAAWLLLLATLITLLTKRGSRWRIASLIAVLIAPLLAIVGIIALYYYPDEAKFAPIERIAVVTADKTVVRTDASRNSEEVIDAPMGSVCEILQQSGRWTYVSLASKTRGWLPSDQIVPIIPHTKPKAPDAKRVKPRPDEGKSA